MPDASLHDRPVLTCYDEDTSGLQKVCYSLEEAYLILEMRDRLNSNDCVVGAPVT
ncbi:protein of unknown function [Micropruina glycogenica]|uniref:Uncharacterized protein n=1 Tax=Micropruina glycogenica TaxID=75385 RepID=A0A2N9JCA6_9ACTN|nr:protein of unknown function [Micropruina glycogenica]